MLKYTCKYWNILAPLVKKSLKKHYGKAFADKTMIKAKSEYRAMLERVKNGCVTFTVRNMRITASVSTGVFRSREDK